MMQFYIKNNDINAFEIVNNKALVTLTLNNKLISNPTIEMLLDDGWKLYTPVPEDNLEKSYEDKVIELIRQKYSLDAELAILRQRDTKVDEFNEYCTYCEKCKNDVKNS